MSILFLPLLHVLACSTDIAVAPPPGEALPGLEPRLDVDSRMFAAEDNGFGFVNPSWGLRGHMDTEGVTVGAERSQLGLRFAAWGRDGDLAVVEPVAPSIGACVHDVRPDGSCARQLEYDRPGVTEWFANLSTGLEQGWDLQDRPAGDGYLVLEIAVDGAEVDGDAAELWFTTASGQAYRYSALAAWDARGEPLEAWFEATDAGLRIVVDDLAATWPIMVDPVLTTAISTMTGESASSNFGYAVEAAGDVNNDGYDDLIVGAYGYASNTGRAYVFHGSSSGISTTAATTLNGGTASDYFGNVVRGAGDVNGDGFDDVVVGAYLTGSSDGAAYVYFGSAAGVTTTGAVTLAGSGLEDRFGQSVAGAGDVNNDGFDDVAVGESAYNSDIGRVYVFHGSAAFDATADTTLGGGVVSYFGFAVDGAGDVNADGFDDLLIGAYGFSSNKGRTYVYHGSSTGIASSPTTTITGGSNSYYNGYDVAGAGDVNGDGYADIITSMYGYGSSLGRAQVYLGGSAGVDTTVDTNLEGTTAGYEFGLAVDGNVDVDADGYSDVVVGENKYVTNVGAAYVYRGSASGIVTTADTTLPGAAGSRFGRAVAGLGDVNGDGYGDVAVGGNALTSSTGKAWVFHGYVDEDGDGYVVGGVGTDQDCDDTDATINPGATDTIADGIDSDCSGTELCYEDVDADGYRTSTTVLSSDTDCSDAGEALATVTSGDCDDTNAAANPGATEVVGDSVDGDCDGTESCYVDADNDGYHTSSTVVSSDTDCSDSGEALASEPDGDCDDTRSTINPGRTETTGNSFDEDCNGSANCYADADVDGYRTTTVIASTDADCSDAGEARSVTASGDCNDANAAINPGAAEVCDAANTDEDCDSAADDADASVAASGKSTWYTDSDGDTYGDAAATVLACDVSAGVVADSTDCDDTAAGVNPGATEVCDPADVDEDCNGAADDADVGASGSSTWYADNDADGFGDAAASIASCDSIPGYTVDNTDCDDSNAAINPAAVEATGDSVDADCNGAEDCYTDADADGARVDAITPSADSDCNDPGEAGSAAGPDCDDTNAAVYPGAAEATGDEVDSDCDGAEDCFTDVDADGYASIDGTVTASADADCGDAGEATSSTPGGDCDDADALYNPGAVETCDDPNDYNCDGSVSFADNDGDGSAACEDCDDSNSQAYPGATEIVANGVDEDCDAGELCYIDADGDGTRVDDTTVVSDDSDCADLGEVDAAGLSGDCDDADAAYYPGADESDCTDPNDYNCDGSTGFADNDADGFPACEECDDTNASIYPGGTEVCNDADDDCDGAVDNDSVDATFWYADADGDTYGDASIVVAECDQPENFVVESTDCNDQDGAINPGEEEVAADGIDQDCDGEDLVDPIDTGDTGDSGDTGDTGTSDDPGDDDVPAQVAGGGGCACDTSEPSGLAAGAALVIAGLGIARRRRSR